MSELSLLLKICNTLTQYFEIKKVLQLVPRLLVESYGMNKSMITILNRKTQEIFIETAWGLTDQELEKGRYKLGEGIVGLVIESGEPFIVPRISEEPLFLDKTGARRNEKKEDLSFICVPIKTENEVIGALCSDKTIIKNNNLENDIAFLTIVATVIAQAVRLHQIDHEERPQLEMENKRLQESLKQQFRPSNIIGNSKVMKQVYSLVDKISKTNTTALILGESGVGKEMIAHAIHYNSERAGKPFIKFNCAALPESIIESELFGHEKGSFTNAVSTRIGRFEQAEGGTIFLDEIGELTPSVQTKLLRILQEREFERVGGTVTIKTNIRIVAATNRNLLDEIQKGKFREDLYYRLNVFPVTIPPLRERKTDILLLADYFINKYSNLNGKNVKRITTPAIDMLMSYHWPGNVRELENCIERAVILTDDDVIHSYHLPPSLQTIQSSNTHFKGSLNQKLESIEMEMISEALKLTKGNISEAAKDLGLTERILGLRIKKYNISAKKFKG